MTIVRKGMHPGNARWSEAEAREMLLDEKLVRTFGDQFQLHLDSGTGSPKEQTWSYDLFAEILGFARPVILHWRTGERVPDETSFKCILTALKLEDSHIQQSSDKALQGFRTRLETAWKLESGGPHHEREAGQAEQQAQPLRA